MNAENKWTVTMHASKCCATVKNLTGRTVARVSDLGGGRSEAERLARLIAAAPEMIDLLAAAVADRTGCHPEPEWMAPARALLARVKGAA